MKSKTSFPLALAASVMAAASTCAAPPAKPAMTKPGAASVFFPANAGVFNVRDPQFGARGDGKTDDTAAIQKALTAGLDQHRIVYLPDGIYLVSDTLKWQDPAKVENNTKGWGRFLMLQGQSTSGTIIRLKEGAPGFGEAESPKAVVQTGSSGGHGNKQYSNGEGNEAFENHLRNFSVETGTENKGAVGIDWQASNCGAMRHVAIRGAGYAGINLSRRDNGPGLIKDVEVQGFRFGIRTQQEIAHFTLEDIRLRNQTEAGIWARDSILGARRISSQNAVPAIQLSGVALVSLFDSDLRGEGAAAVAVQGTEARLYVRNLKTSGYAGSVRQRGQTQKPVLDEWSSDAPLGSAGGKLSLGLPIRETPEWFEPDVSKWAVASAPTGGDDSAVIQKALDAGRATVFLPYGRYRIERSLRVPSGVRLITGAGGGGLTMGKFEGDGAALHFEGGKASDLTIVDRFEVGGENSFLTHHTDARAVVLRDIMPWSGKIYHNERGSGPLFIENVSGNGYRFAPGSRVWARQFNAEGSGRVVNDGGTVWLLGTKHEGGETIFENKNGGRMEVWSSMSYSFGVDRNQPFAINEDAALSLQLAGITFMGPGGFFDLLVRDTQKGQASELRRAELPGRGGGAFVPLFVSGVGKAGASTSASTSTVPATASRAASTSTSPVRASTSAATPQVFNAPELFDGEQNGQPTGNPLEVGGKPLWTAAQIWPDDPLKRENYKPMLWEGDTWRGAYEFGGQPGLKVEAGRVTLGVRGGWGGDGTMPGNKMAALIFTAPARGTYSVTGTARAGVWQGDKAAATLSVLKSDVATGKVTRVRSIPTPGDADVALEGVPVELEAGQEIILAPLVTQMYTAANIELRDLKIQFAAAATAPLKAGDAVEINGKKYKVTKAEGKTLTLREDG
jgi:hypothetical protein